MTAEKYWIESELPIRADIQNLSTQLNVSVTLSYLLHKRGITTFDEARFFFRPSLDALHDPFLMKDMQKAATRIEMAIAHHEKILVYGDYDVDGTTAVSLVFDFLRSHAHSVDFYIPDRHTEGYGISYKGIDWARQNNFTLIVALDCGIKSVNQVDYAAHLGIDFVIADHHLPGSEIPAAVAVLDPKQPGCSYPFKELSGCGIAFKLIQALNMRSGQGFEDPSHYLDFVAVSIASDIVPVTGENRILAYHGLKKLNTSPGIGFKTLIHLLKQQKPLNFTDVAFYLGPRINAVGRLDDARKVVHLLGSCDDATAGAQGEYINGKNDQRKSLDEKITKHALALLEEVPGYEHKKTTVLCHPDWHKGVIGIVASRLIEKYYRPTIVLTVAGEKATGSARSVADFDIYDAINECSDLLEQFGGHKHAAGLTLPVENLALFSSRFEHVVSERINASSLFEKIVFDTDLSFSEIDMKLVRILEQFGPYGKGNEQPLFVTRGVVCREKPVVLGTKHIKCTVYQADIGFNTIAFNKVTLLPLMASGYPFDICYAIEKNEWNGQTSIQLIVKDVKRNPMHKI